MFDIKKYEECLPVYKRIVESLVEKYPFFSYTGPPRSMRNIDLSVVYYLIKEYKPDCFFESGIWWGRCSFIIAECIKQLDIGIPYYMAANKSADHEGRLKILVADYPFVKKHRGGGERHSNKVKDFKRVGMLIDGPKWRDKKKMQALYENIMTRNKLLFSFHHDVTPGHTKDYPNWRTFCKNNKKMYTSHLINDYVSKKSRKYIERPDPEIKVAVNYLMTGFIINKKV